MAAMHGAVEPARIVVIARTALGPRPRAGWKKPRAARHPLADNVCRGARAGHGQWQGVMTDVQSPSPLLPRRRYRVRRRRA